MTDTDRQTLSTRGTVYVSHAAAVEYARVRELSLEPARRELTELLLDARETTTPGQWRYRRRVDGIDISARVQTWNRLAIVTHILIRKADR